MRRRIIALATTALAVAACAHPSQFDRYIADGNWADAAREFAADSTLRANAHGLYQAGVLFGTPGRPTYDPDAARRYLNDLLMKFPGSPYRDDATARLQLLEEMQRTTQTAAARQKEIEAQIAALTKESRDIRVRFDSVVVVNDSLRASIGRLEADRKDRDEQLRLLRLELQKLKEIDLKPRRPPVISR